MATEPLPRVPNCKPWPEWHYATSRLERVARELGVDPLEFRWWLHEEVDRRSRERAAVHARAHGQLDRKIGVQENGR